MSLKNCIIVLWIFVMYGLGLWMFFSGYLLKRIVVHKNSTQILNVCRAVKCHDYASLQIISEMFDAPFGDTSSLDGLKRYNKAVLLIIDALRYDFVMYTSTESSGTYYLNKMPVFSEMLNKHPERCLLLKMVADPPTTTLQRLTGITTGSLPTFIDISLNFASTAIKEDNVIWQLNNMKKKIVFLGDNTWEGLFPNQFHRSFAFPSFNVKDLHTVDNGILNNIYQELQKDDWDVIIAHFLGVDHCGHRYGPNHPAMADKLHQMNNVIQNVVDKIQDDTVLFVLGDHGMTESGDHGGDSQNEISTALFVYSPSVLTKERHLELQKSSMLQIDLVPTLSMLLGIPIPFSSLGSALPQVFTVQNFSTEKYCFHEEVDSVLAAALALAENAYQVHQYLLEYASISQDLSPAVLSTAESLLQNTSVLWNEITGNNRSETVIHLYAAIDGYEKYLKFVQSECNKKWAKFDFETMACGIIILCVTILINLLFACSTTSRISMIKLHLLMTIITFITYAFYFQIAYIGLLYLTVISVFCIYCLKRYAWTLLELLCKVFTLPNSITVLLLCSGFSNSFIIYEDRVILFLLQTCVLCRHFSNTAHNVLVNFTLGTEKSKKGKPFSRKTNSVNWVFLFLLASFLIIIRLSYIFRRCREEQLICETSHFLTSLENLAAVTSVHQIIRLGLSWIAVLTPVVAAIAFAHFMHPENYTAGMICLNYGVVFSAVCICLHWWLSLISPQVLDRILGQNQVIAAQCALVTCVIIFFVTWIFPLLPEKPLELSTNLIFRASMLLLALSVLLPLYLLSGDGLATSLTLMVIAMLIILILNSLTSNTSGLYESTNVVIWGLSSYHWFYSSGHQPTFPALQWDAAFIASNEVISYTLSGTFVVMNTFSSQIFHGLMLPLLLFSSKPPKHPEPTLFLLVLKYLSFYSFKLLSSVLSCFFLRRHLMVWKIFTPKLIFEVLGFFVTAFSSFLGYLFVIRITSCLHKQIKKNAGQLWFLKDD